MKVYIVDDDVDMVGFMEMTLKAAGHEVESQNDRDGLLENIRRFRPGLIILDVMFPGDQEAGFKMAREIRHDGEIGRTPILMLTSVNRESDFPSKFSRRDIDEIYLPVTEFLEKPIDPRLLLKKVEELGA